MRPVSRLLWLTPWLALAACLLVSGCGTPGAPLPPSLKLPDPVTDLSASRTGNQVTLAWTTSKKNTDKLLLKGETPVCICRKEAAGPCAQVANSLSLAPGTSGSFSETLPLALASGPPRPLTYILELPNRNGRSAGPSNPATILAGQAPAVVAGLSAIVRKDGIALRWAPDASSQSAPTAIRLHRKLLTPRPVEKPSSQTVLFAPEPEPLERTLLVDRAGQAGGAPNSTLDRALDTDIRLGETYEYRAQRVARISVDGRVLELAGELSAPIRVEALDIFPPAVPTALAAVANAGQDGAPPSIDLIWQPVPDAGLAGYAVYRREEEGSGGVWRRISPAEPLNAPAFHDAHVQPGRSYRYAVTAIDERGHESARSAEAQETVPTP
jgi:hypothetical protein